ncbi:MAG TPA: hypothetical protein DC049_12970, partial [Spirochaetia bacterium]|nr:hypothetical protein [Spirochaetia bacterium]
MNGHEDKAVYGPGYIQWGIQSCWQYCAVMASLYTFSGAAQCLNRALGVFRYLLSSHHTGSDKTTEGKKWGRTWISVLGIERAMNGIRHLFGHISPAEKETFFNLLADECTFMLEHGNRNGESDVMAGLWAKDHHNAPESNIWNGAFLWRISRLLHTHPQAAAWAERAHDYLVNGISISDDANNQTLLHGISIAGRHKGANFFPHFGLDHHGYMNVGYMIICLSNAAILYFDSKSYNFDLPQTLFHHQKDLWEVVRNMIFNNGRLARIGGDSRLRYTYCQEYLLPVLLYAADYFHDTSAWQMADALLALMEKEQKESDSGFFYAHRLGYLAEHNPLYYARLEADRACVLAMLCNYLPLINQQQEQPESSVKNFSWVEEQHGSVLERSADRFASFSWRARGLGQALCVPPERSDLAEWESNLCPVIIFIGTAQGKSSRRLLSHSITQFPGGFVTCGKIMEGTDMYVAEGGQCTDQAVSSIAFAALPDGHTCIGLQYTITAPDLICYTREVKGLHLNIPNDLFNNYRRKLRFPDSSE